MAMYLAIDLGTTGCRSILFNSNLEMLESSYEEYGITTPRENWVEQDANMWWELTKKTIKDVIYKAGIDGHNIKGISISSQGITVVPVDRNFNPLFAAINWLDTRAVTQIKTVSEKINLREMFTHTGKRLSSAYTLPKIIWIRENAPEIYDRTYMMLMPMDFLNAKFTGNPVTDYSMASGTLMYDIKNNCWSKKILDMFGISSTLLPEIRGSGEIVGNLLPDVADELGLSTDCVVANGAQDQKCAALGAGLKDGTMTISLGTAMAIIKIWNQPKTEGSMTIGWCGYVNNKSWVTEGVGNTGGSTLRWLRDTMYKGEDYDIINKEAEEARNMDSSLICFPYLNGASSPDNNPEMVGCFYGANLASTRGCFALAVMEGVACHIRKILEAMDAYGNVEHLILFGGGANSPIWCQEIADITGMDITVPVTHEAAAAGAAILAGIGVGDFDAENPPSLTAKTIYTPLKENHKKYEMRYRRYIETERKMWGKED